MTDRLENPILQVLRGIPVEPKPIWLMRQAGRYLPEYREIRAKTPDFLSLCFTPSLATEVTLQPIRRFGFDAAILFSDILVIPHALGQRVWFAEGEGPRLEPIASAAHLKPDSVVETLSSVLETVASVRAKLPAQTALIGFAGAPWTVATYMFAGRGGDDGLAALTKSYVAPADFAALIDMLVEATAAYLIAQIKAGAQALQIFESWAETIPAQFIDAYSIKPIQTIIAKIRREAPNVPIIVFPRGAGLSLPRYATDTGASAISVDTHTQLASLRTKLPPALATQGNLDPIALIQGGDALRKSVRNILAATEGTPHIFNLGHGIRPETPIANVEELIRLVRNPAA